ncbi:ABC transporter ATP-binding protein [Paenibacillus sp. BJ-4]|uniref:ABC transporter ATP-binding protein n=1 Tax=Paenibacillus sp. BJ-4 TaxID=2878097 RepID=UPI001CEFEF7D|nr:ABC transporter ATP-binding protein [Paenibacillus sp. BJ-4]
MISNSPIIEVSELSKSFGSRTALNNVTFDVHQGEILCFLGPNGAGKTTTINILSTSLRGDKGNIRYCGEPVERLMSQYKRELGIVPQDLAVYEDISTEANVRFFASLYGLTGTELEQGTNEALEIVGLADRRKDKPKTFSGGMKRRLNLACAIAHRPKMIIMDEPTVGIDPQSRNHILGSIRKLRDEGATIIYTTHYMEEVEEISTRILIIDHGEVIASGTKEELKERLADEKRYEVEVEEISEMPDIDLYRIDGVKKVDIVGNRIHISTLKGIENLDQIIVNITSNGLKIINLTGFSPSLEMVFLNLTGRTLRD